MKIASSIYCVPEGTQVKLRKWPTITKPVYKSKSQYHKLLADHVEQLSELQELRYASNRHALLLIFQAMDAEGEDGAIRHVMSGVNPQGCQVFSFEHPTATELEHDFLWRPAIYTNGAHRHLQSILERGGAHRTSASRNSSHRGSARCEAR